MNNDDFNLRICNINLQSQNLPRKNNMILQ